VKSELEERADDKGDKDLIEKSHKKMQLKSSEMNRNGVIKIEFSESTYVPDFSILSKLPAPVATNGTNDENDPKRRNLVGLKNINVQRDLMSVNLVVKSNVEREDIKYFLEVSEWTEQSISIFMNFTTPLLVSKGLERDEVYMSIINPYLFIS